MDYRARFDLQNTSLWPELRASELLEDAGVRHCIVGDVVSKILGYPLIIGDVFLAVADEQLETASSILSGNNYHQVPQVNQRFIYRRATKESPTGWPGYRFVVDPTFPPLDAGVMLVPASLWHMDLQPENLQANTFLYPGSRCRLPKRTFYIDALIDAISERFGKDGYNLGVSGLFFLEYSYLMDVIPKDFFLQLPPENQFFVELFDTVLVPSAQEKVCRQRQRIRKGLISVEAARSSIPRKDLELAAIKAKYHQK